MGEIEIRVQALKRTLGVVDHYYMVIGGKEYHPGGYGPGSVLPLGTTKGYHTAVRRQLCRDCFDKIVLDFVLSEDKRIYGYYPFLNCESLSTGISVQSQAFVFVPFVLIQAFRANWKNVLVLLLLALLFVLAASKFVFSRTQRQKCSHLPAYIS